MKYIQTSLKGFTTIIFSTILSFAFTQNSFESKVYQEICKALLIQNENIIIKNELTSFKVSYLIPNLEVHIDTIKQITSIEEEILKDISKEKLEEILLSEEFSLFPLPESITIVDALNFFSTKKRFRKDSYLFKTSKKSSKLKNLLNLGAFEAIENKFLIGLNYKDFYFTLILNGETFKLEDYTIFQLRN